MAFICRSFARTNRGDSAARLSVPSFSAHVQRHVFINNSDWWLLAAFRGLWLRGDPEVERAELHTASGGGPRCRRASQTPFSPPPNRGKTRRLQGDQRRGERTFKNSNHAVCSLLPPPHTSTTPRLQKQQIHENGSASAYESQPRDAVHQRPKPPAETSYRQRIARSAKPANKTSVLQFVLPSRTHSERYTAQSSSQSEPRGTNHALSRASLRRTDWCIALVACHVTFGRSATTWSHVTLSELWIGSWRPHAGNSLAK